MRRSCCLLSDQISHPKHYNFGKYEVIDVIYDWNLDFDLGNVIKYIARAGRKNKNTYLEDLKKAREYLDHKIYFEETIKKEVENNV